MRPAKKESIFKKTKSISSQSQDKPKPISFEGLSKKEAFELRRVHSKKKSQLKRQKQVEARTLEKKQLLKSIESLSQKKSKDALQSIVASRKNQIRKKSRDYSDWSATLSHHQPLKVHNINNEWLSNDIIEIHQEKTPVKKKKETPTRIRIPPSPSPQKLVTKKSPTNTKINIADLGGQNTQKRRQNMRTLVDTLKPKPRLTKQLQPLPSVRSGVALSLDSDDDDDADNFINPSPDSPSSSLKSPVDRSLTDKYILRKLKDKRSLSKCKKKL